MPPPPPLCLLIQIHTVDKYGGIYSESTEPIDAVNVLPLARFEPTISTTPPCTTSDIDATNCATETSPKKNVQIALIVTTTNEVHVVYWFLFNAWHLFVRKRKPDGSKDTSEIR